MDTPPDERDARMTAAAAAALCPSLGPTPTRDDVGAAMTFLREGAEALEAAARESAVRLRGGGGSRARGRLTPAPTPRRQAQGEQRTLAVAALGGDGTSVR